MASNCYRIEPPFYVSFSGGRTSGYMLRKIIDAWGGTLPEGGHVLFANTGREHPETLKFVDKVQRSWCAVTWIEYRVDTPYAVVNYETASVTGEPFAALIAKRKYLPNPVARFCTSDLKVKPMAAYMKKLHEQFTTVIGLRYDEPMRVAKLRGDSSRDIALPLADAKATRETVMEFWKQYPFDLNLPNGDIAFGNCDLCFLKSRAATDRVMEQNPKSADWWIQQERAIGGTFRSDRPNYATMLHQVTIQGRLFDEYGPTDTTLPCDCTE
jgi:3'-phosphoadenosine 5'-phosphosulfate sulfotransferase (PAPS reductase)/FAD synthetase